MKININVKRKFKFNGKEYNSIEEMPDDIRETFRKAIGLHAGSGQGINHTATRTKIIFNGTEYESIDAMPQDVRGLYEKVLKAAENGTASPEINIAGISSSIPVEHQSPGIVRSGYERTKAESSFSPRALIVSIALVALILLIYYLLRS